MRSVCHHHQQRLLSNHLVHLIWFQLTSFFKFNMNYYFQTFLLARRINSRKSVYKCLNKWNIPCRECIFFKEVAFFESNNIFLCVTHIYESILTTNKKYKKIYIWKGHYTVKQIIFSTDGIIVMRDNKVVNLQLKFRLAPRQIDGTAIEPVHQF